MPATAKRGFPYPSPGDPVAQGAAAIQALAERADTTNQSTLVGRSTFQALTPGGPYVLIYYDAIHWQDWTALSGGNCLVPDVAGRYRVTASVQFSGQTGGVAPSIARLTQQNSAGGLKRYAFAETSSLNSGCTIALVCNASAGDKFLVELWSGAGAAGGSGLVELCLEKLGPIAASLLLDALEDRDRLDTHPADELEPEPR